MSFIEYHHFEKQNLIANYPNIMLIIYFVLCLQTYSSCIKAGWEGLSVQRLVQLFQIWMSEPLRLISQDKTTTHFLVWDITSLLLFKKIPWHIRVGIQLLKEAGFAGLEQLVLFIDLNQGVNVI